MFVKSYRRLCCQIADDSNASAADLNNNWLWNFTIDPRLFSSINIRRNDRMIGFINKRQQAVNAIVELVVA